MCWETERPTNLFFPSIADFFNFGYYTLYYTQTTHSQCKLMSVFLLKGIYFYNNLKKSFKDNSKILIASPNVFFQSFFGSNKEDVQRTL